MVHRLKDFFVILVIFKVSETGEQIENGIYFFFRNTWEKLIPHIMNFESQGGVLKLFIVENAFLR
ncbi:hypothetical protein SDC9_159649 [bioreactor metagenome]|uniref:Uncharacterized protein n=1 Tax=bioreactor metagenome TaxID=1076179 RepID=A0A645FJC0_9ZZZZ